MPRHARIKSPSGHFHVIVRGIGKQLLFEEDQDHRYFLEILRTYCAECNVTLYAYCLMSNHVHMLIHDPGDNISAFMKKIGVKYARYFNLKYERSGHLFQDRYISEPILSEFQLLAVFRYILNNPQKAGICPAFAYEWSSYSLYGVSNPLVDTSLIQALLGDTEAFIAFMRQPNTDQFLEDQPEKRDDEWAKNMLRAKFGINSATFLQTLPKSDRDIYIRQMKQSGLSVRQIARLSGIGRNIVQRACQKMSQ